MKIGLYDSGLGGISVLNKFLENYPGFDYVYFGDSLRAPYGDKSPEELKGFVYEIFDFMQEKKVDLVVSACNTSSMFLHEIDMTDYDFKVISLFDVMKDYFEINVALEENKCGRKGQARYSKSTIGFLATPTNIESAKYKEWDMDIYPVKCPKLVPLVEAGDLEAAKAEFKNYLAELPEEISNVIVGCTHYSFLKPENSRFNFIDPADIVVRSAQLTDSLKESQSSHKAVPEIHVTGDLVKFMETCEKLIKHEEVSYEHKMLSLLLA